MVSNSSFYENLVDDEALALRIRMEVDSLRNFVNYKIESSISLSLENTKVHNKAQYESKVVVKQWDLPKDLKPSSSFNGQSRFDIVFAKDDAEKRFLANKISPANNPMEKTGKGWGRGILADRGRQQIFRTPPKKPFMNSKSQDVRCKSPDTRSIESISQAYYQTNNNITDDDNLLNMDLPDEISTDWDLSDHVVRQCQLSTRYRKDYGSTVLKDKTNKE